MFVFSPRGVSASALIGLTLVTHLPASSFQQWREEQFTPGVRWDDGISSPAADPDGDGASNFLEYALGMTPLLPDGENLPSFTLDEEVLSIEFSTPQALAPWVSFLLQTSPNLLGWALHNNVQPVQFDDDGQFRWLRLTDPNPITAATPRRFARLAVFDLPPGTSIVSPPIRLHAANGTPVELNWTDQSNVETGFQVDRKTGIFGAWETLATTGPDVSIFSDAGASVGVEYIYRVGSRFADASVLYGASLAVTPEASYSAAGLRGIWQSPTSLLLNWTPTGGEQSRIERWDPFLGWVLVAVIDGDEGSFLDIGLEIGQAYFYRVVTLDAFGKVKGIEITGDAQAAGFMAAGMGSSGGSPSANSRALLFPELADDPEGDWDDDGLTNEEESEVGADPYHPDSDGDGLLDGEEAVPTVAEMRKPAAPESNYALIDLGDVSTMGYSQGVNDAG